MIFNLSEIELLAAYRLFDELKGARRVAAEEVERPIIRLTPETRRPKTAEAAEPAEPAEVPALAA